ncbi:MAG TPA: SUMF1/EgtB/PvdO family nonheme iron enzyme [Gemmataceae bacterium]
MPGLHTFLECLGQALCERGRAALAGEAPFAECLPDVARAAIGTAAERGIEGGAFRDVFREALRTPSDALAGQVSALVSGLAAVQTVPHPRDLAAYLAQIPAAVRRALRRPSDPDGDDVPEALSVEHGVDLLPFLPARPCRLRAGQKVLGVGDWELNEWVGNGSATEAWQGWDEARPEESPALLKFVAEPALRPELRRHTGPLQRALDLDPIVGVVPLRSVYLDGDPPCAEYAYVDGYDLAGFVREMLWRFDEPRPDMALRIVRRVAEIVGALHRLDPPVVHRDLKPSNVLFRATGQGKFTLWGSDLGWGEISARHNLERGRHTARSGGFLHEALRGAHSPLYASPQQAKGAPPDPRDDVYALGAIWYQLLTRDPHAGAPVGHEWANEFLPFGLTEEQALLLEACLATRPDRRPADAQELAERLAALPVPAPGAGGGPGSFILKGGGTGVHRPLRAQGAGEPGAEAEAGGLPKLLRNSIGLCLARIPAGRFVMGSPEDEPGRQTHEGPAHEVTLTRPFYLAVTPVTQAQFEEVMGRNPSAFGKGHGGGPEHPVERVTWAEAVEFCDCLSALPEERAAGRVYRLPTEAEWEYACRAGTTAPYCFGKLLTPELANFATGASLGHHGQTTPVAKYAANAFLLYDMHGNVQEWCADWYDEFYYFESPPADPPGPKRGELRVVRGGSWSQFAAECRSAARLGAGPDRRSNDVGFRVALSIKT